VEAAFFDLDKTVIAKASMVAFGGPFYRGGLVSRRTILRGLYGQLIYLHLGASEQKLARIRESVLALSRGWDQQTVRQIVREALEEIVEPIIYSEALELIEVHRAAGRKVFIVSASPEEIVTPLGSYLGADGVIASKPKVDDRGRYTGEMAFYSYGPYKAEAMRELAQREGIDLSASYAYTDSYTDAPMLEAVGHPVAVNPDRVLLKMAREHDWEVRQFVRPVRLRPRVSAPSPPAAAAAAAVVAAAGAAIVLWRLGGRRQPAQSTRSFLAAATPRATRMAKTRSFFMPDKPSPSRPSLFRSLTRAAGTIGPPVLVASRRIPVAAAGGRLASRGGR
jgi:HAD superfamily hydrolase (TIGR01490 family)